MKTPKTSIDLILTVWPNLTFQEAQQIARTPQNLQKALYHYTQKYTQYCVEELAGMHLSDIVYKDTPEFVPDFKWTNLFLDVKPFEQSDTYSLGSFLLTYGYFAHIQPLLEHLTSFGATPEKISQALRLETIQQSMQDYIFSKTTIARTIQEKREKTLKKYELDICLNAIGQHIGFLNMFEQIFHESCPNGIEITQKYSFQKKSKTPSTLLEMCVKNNLPITTLRFTQQLFEKEKNITSIITLFEEPILQQEIKTAYEARCKHYKNPLTKLVDYLETILPSNHFIQLATGKQLYPYHSETSRDLLLAKMKQAEPNK